MAAATSNMATTTFKAATYNPNMPPELAEDLPPSAGMIIQLIKDLRVDLKNDFKNDFDALYGAMEGINQRTEIIENRLHFQEQSHLDLVETVKELQKQVHQQAEKLAEAEDRSRRNNLRIRGIPDNIDSQELHSYFQTMVKSALPNVKNTDLLLDRIHRLPKPGNAPPAAPKDVIVIPLLPH
ncbi:Hypothetical predicted protein [Pelobates cultripes]|uniref:Uncharacterized protein n=1 Tax=Pelobates cultripes TaxID=61616 RepID=A0AAD1QZ65_PELCU|nr:Hypothetical predicted protein [Pelobates cultripes]